VVHTDNVLKPLDPTLHLLVHEHMSVAIHLRKACLLLVRRHPGELPRSRMQWAHLLCPSPCFNDMSCLEKMQRSTCRRYPARHCMVIMSQAGFAARCCFVCCSSAHPSCKMLTWKLV
jgi:hypothetical protein